jgi:hypothetical protein
VVLLASPAVGSYSTGAYSYASAAAAARAGFAAGHSATVSNLHAPERVVHERDLMTPIVLSHPPASNLVPPSLAGGDKGGSWVSPEAQWNMQHPQQTRGTSNGGATEVLLPTNVSEQDLVALEQGQQHGAVPSSLYPSMYTAPSSLDARSQSSLLSPSAGMEVSIFSTPGSDFLAGRRASSYAGGGSLSGMASPHLSGSVGAGAGGFGGGGMRRGVSEYAPGASLTPGSASHLRSESLAGRPPRSVSSATPRLPSGRSSSSAGSGALPPPRPRDVLVQKGSLIYRRAGAGGSTPLDSSRGNEKSDRSSLMGDSLAVAFAPGSSSSFTVQSPISNREYSMPRRSSIFAHTRGHLERLAAAAERNAAAYGGRSGSRAGMSPSVASPNRVYTAPTLRTSDPSTLALGSPQAFSAMGPHTMQRLAQQVGSYNIQGQPESFAPHSTVGTFTHPVGTASGSSEDVPLWAQHNASGDQGGSTVAPAPTPASTYVPNQFLAAHFGGNESSTAAEQPKE